MERLHSINWSNRARDNKENCTCTVAKTPHGPPSCCMSPIVVSGSELNLHAFFGNNKTKDGYICSIQFCIEDMI
jgi:hypothetical protein